MAVTIIVAMSRNRVIGKANDLPWYLPADLRHFKEITDGHTVIVGRKTHESIIARLGHPLPGRKTIVVTRQKVKFQTGVAAVNSLADALALAKGKDIFIIGGAEIYVQAFPICDRLLVTQVDTEIKGGDTFFPEIDSKLWEKTSEEHHLADEKNLFAYSFITYERS